MPEPTLERGDITTFDVDAIVNAANPMMLGGGGVDGAIHAAAGPRLLEACRQSPAVGGIRCPFGEARITPGFDLPARWVIHAVGPIWGRTPEPELVLTSAYENSLALASTHGLASVAFPAISTGAYGFPLDAAARIAVEVTRRRWGSVDDIRFVLARADVFEAFERALQR
ncbi:O-acetyl-ADP-ribose deacetylase [Enhygromyxa salina]|uniref:O-acetyl-ADP-ribose deacetylase n=1 Tax=Enhygromyxa salina TaxID=215803 RepID=A0A2S9YVE6_9BACT|nr:O-acetyl-ADP-ribose deacetylase [Enhygromyxa salina]PRQ09077.1 O-acetyl-ADP-ribose deacetylase [Enhygromyxa salina]